MLSIKEIPDPSHRPARGRGLTYEAREGEKRVGLARFSDTGETISLTDAEWSDRAILDGLVRAGFFAAMMRGVLYFSREIRQPDTQTALDELDIPAQGELARFFAGGCKGGCDGDCTACRG